MTNTRPSKTRSLGEPDTEVALHRLMTEAPLSGEQHSKRLVKRGDTRRKIEDHLLTKASQDLW
ncbi:hypothetical protein [Chitinimonas taiwanensis]|jgi:hypothetical protein|uniref:Uncharacterized protein n=1 Tax=Chitinimonas taiwanensis DSM 18899 TaxID=1121279 RepID=A0A1K2HA48_9NEIS|nr:hypothetical protein [Chitinimonas taiwanensis]SFZ73664.1 hypothetical protein SAMN02745887_00937 [Chitinimonas taiwanensis DSM 18899]